MSKTLGLFDHFWQKTTYLAKTFVTYLFERNCTVMFKENNLLCLKCMKQKQPLNQLVKDIERQ